MIRVIVADDHAIVRDGISSLLSTEPDIEVVAEATNGKEADELVERYHPDIVLMDLMMPEMDGVEATRAIRASATDTQVLVLTSFAAEDRLLPALRAGAQGYLLKQSGADELIGAILQVHSGGSSLDPAVTGMVLQELARESKPRGPTEALTDRELEVLRLIAKGMSNQQIADSLVISDATVRNHVSSILGKLQVESRTQAALYALREGLATLEDSEP